MCSRILGPATSPCFVTCPTMNILILFVLLRKRSLFVASFICATLPDTDEISPLFIVCIESIITTLGFLLNILFSTISKSVSHNKSNSSLNLPSLKLLSFICEYDSSPDIYKTLFLLSVNVLLS